MFKYRNIVFMISDPDFSLFFPVIAGSAECCKYRLTTIFFPKSRNIVLKIFISCSTANTTPPSPPPPFPPLEWIDACFQNFQAAINLLIKWHIWERVMKLSIKKTLVSNTFFYKKKVKYFSSIYPLRNKVYLCGDTCNCCWNCCFFVVSWEWCANLTWRCWSINFLKQWK